jgi:hypothetical protein
MDNGHKSNRRERRGAEASGEMTNKRFMEISDRFIDVANRENKRIPATDLHMAFLYAAARYNAHVGKNVIELEEHEPFVREMVKAYQEMLRTHLADPSI